MLKGSNGKHRKYFVLLLNELNIDTQQVFFQT